MLYRYSPTITTILFALVLFGVIFAAQPAQGYSAQPASTQARIPANVHYHLDTAAPSRITMVSFTLPSTDQAQATPQVRARLSGTWYNCAASGNTWRCETPDGPRVAAVEQLEVMVAHEA